MQERDENGYIKVGTTIKHFLYGLGMGGVNTASMDGGVNHLYNDLAIPYIRVLKENPTAIMISYSSIDRIPMSMNTALIQGMLRSEMGFQGLIMSDAMGILHLFTESKMASSHKDAAIKALRAGLQLELAPRQPACFPFLVNSSNDQEIVDLVDEAVRQHLIIKFETGMFDLALPTPENLNRTLRAPEHLEINRQASREAIVLLSNDGCLPQSNLSKVALIGPFGDILDPGSYAPSTAANPLHGQTLKDSLETRFGSANVQYIKGVEILTTSTNDKTGIEDAVTAAKNAGIAIVALGSLSVYFLDPLTDQRTDGEFFTHESLGFPGSQQQLLDAVLDTGVPTILVLNGGQAFILNNSTMRANAILHQFLGGELSADALVEIITGQVNPSGKLTISMPQAEGAFPIYYDYLPSDNVGGAGAFNGCAGDWSDPCLDRDGAPMAFGYGLSYTTFDISSPQISNSRGVSISCTITNTGNVAGKEVVQVYFRQQYSDIELPNKRLIRFQKIELHPGEARRVEFTIDQNELGYYKDAKYQVDSGHYTFWVGSSSRMADLKNATISL
jgi:beta-glucosidase